MWRILRWLFLCVLVAGAVWYVRTHEELLEAVRRIPWQYLLAVAGLAASSRLLQGLQFKLLYEAFEARLSFREWFGLSICNTMYNYLVPGRVGLAARAYYLKRVHGLSYAHFGAVLAGSNMLNLVVAATAGLAASLASAAMGPAGSGLRMAAVFAALLGASAGGLLTLMLSARTVRL